MATTANHPEVVNTGAAAVAWLPNRNRHNPTWLTGAENLGGRWDSASGVWLFPAAAETHARDLARKTFGICG